MEIGLVLERGSKLTWFWCSGQDDLFLVWGSIDSVFVSVVEIGLVFAFGPKTLCGHRNFPGFCVGGRS